MVPPADGLGATQIAPAEPPDDAAPQAPRDGGTGAAAPGLASAATRMLDLSEAPPPDGSGATQVADMWQPEGAGSETLVGAGGLQAPPAPGDLPATFVLDLSREPAPEPLAPPPPLSPPTRVGMAPPSFPTVVANVPPAPVQATFPQPYPAAPSGLPGGFCPQCGASTQPGAQFCNGCGAALWEGLQPAGRGAAGRMVRIGALVAVAVVAAAVGGFCVVFANDGGDTQAEDSTPTTAAAAGGATPTPTSTSTAAASATPAAASPSPAATNADTPQPTTAPAGATVPPPLPPPTNAPATTAPPTAPPPTSAPPTSTPVPPTATRIPPTNTPVPPTPTRTSTPVPPTPTPPPVTYQFSASLDGSEYYVGDTAWLCYEMTPHNIAYDLYLYQTQPNYGLVDSWSDNGLSGGDCVPLTMTHEDLGPITIVIQAVINGKTGSVTLYAYVYGSL